MVYLAEYSIWSVRREKVYRSKIADVDNSKHVWSMSDRRLTTVSRWRRYQPVASLSKRFYPCSLRGAHVDHKFWQFWIKLIILPMPNKPYFGLLCAN